jgi:hypothetical protein
MIKVDLLYYFLLITLDIDLRFSFNAVQLLLYKNIFLDQSIQHFYYLIDLKIFFNYLFVGIKFDLLV